MAFLGACFGPGVDGRAALNAASGHLASPIRKIKLREVKQCA